MRLLALARMLVMTTVVAPEAMAEMPVGLLMVAAPGVALESVPDWSTRPFGCTEASPPQKLMPTPALIWK